MGDGGLLGAKAVIRSGQLVRTKDAIGAASSIPVSKEMYFDTRKEFSDFGNPESTAHICAILAMPCLAMRCTMM